MALTVLSVAYPLAPVGPDAVGGAEQVLTQLNAALCRFGHRSIVVACEGSVTEGTLQAVPKITGILDEQAHRHAHARHRQAIEQALNRWPVDLVHMHGIDFYEYLPCRRRLYPCWSLCICHPPGIRLKFLSSTGPARTGN